MDKPQVTTLDNGFTIVTQHMPTKQVYANVAIGVGSRHETEQESGISHYLEHMLASDTSRMTSEEQDELVQNMRGYSNASTDYDKTDYFYRVGNEFTEDVVRMLADSIQSATLDPKRIEVERKAVQEEMRNALSDPGQILHDQLLQVAFPGTGLDKSIGGDVETVANHTRDDLLAFMKKHYTADKMTLTVVGDVSHEEIVEMAKKHFTDLPQIPKEKQIEEQPAVYRGGMRTHHSGEVEQVTMQMGFEAAGSNDQKKAMTDKVLASVLGGGFSSRLMKSLRSEKGLVYYAHAAPMSFADSGVFTIEAATQSETAAETMQAICEEVNSLRNNITEDELKAVKNALLGSLERSVENAESVASSLVRSMTVNGRPTDVDKSIELLEDVSLEDLQQRANEIFSTAPSISAHGNGVDKLPDYQEITRMLGNERELDASGLAKESVPSTDRAAANSNIAGRPVEQEQRRAAS